MKNILSIISLSSVLLLSSFKADKEKVYQVDTAKSTLVWVGKKVTGQHTGNISISSGSLTWGDKKLKSGNFEINVASLTVTDIDDKEKNEKLVGHLKNEDFFSVDKFPKATFKIVSVEDKGVENYLITVNLTIKDITQPVSFPATIKANGKTIIASGLITVNRTKFDIKFKSASFFENLGDKAIYDDFTLDVKLVANNNVNN